MGHKNPHPIKKEKDRKEKVIGSWPGTCIQYTRLQYKQFYLQLTSEYSSSEFVFTDGSKTEAGVAAAAVSTKHPRKPLTCRLPDDSSIYTAELRAILLTLKRINCSKRKSFLILSDSLSSLKAIFNLRGNSAADAAAKDALVGDTSVELIPLSDLKSRANKYIYKLWQSEWDELPGNKLHEIFPV